MRDKIIQLGAALLLVTCMVGAGSLLNPILKESDDARLRYTDVSIEGAPPIVARGNPQWRPTTDMWRTLIFDRLTSWLVARGQPVQQALRTPMHICGTERNPSACH